MAFAVHEHALGRDIGRCTVAVPRGSTLLSVFAKNGVPHLAFLRDLADFRDGLVKRHFHVYQTPWAFEQPSVDILLKFIGTATAYQGRDAPTLVWHVFEEILNMQAPSGTTTNSTTGTDVGGGTAPTPYPVDDSDDTTGGAAPLWRAQTEAWRPGSVGR